jgi:hypothetical protein
MPRYKLWIDVSIATASVVLGIIISPIFERLVDPLFGSETRASLVGILVLGLVIVAGIAAIGAYIRRDEIRGESLSRSIQEIRNKLGLSARFVTDLPRAEGTGELYRRANEIISQAEKEIWVLWHCNHYLARRSEEEIRSEGWRMQRDIYHETLLRKCNEHKRDTFFYRRILQIPNSADVKDGVISSKVLSYPTIVKHCKELLDYIRQNPETAVLKYAPIFLPQTIVLVDERYVLWEIDAIDPDTQSEYMDAVLIFDDADKQFIRYMKNFFLKVDAHSYMVKQVAD